MKIQKLDVVVAILAGITCLGLLVNIPVWALFIGWAWYFALGATPDVLKQAIPALLIGYILAAISIVVYAASGFQILAMIIAVAVTVFILMMSLKLDIFSCSLASFNAYSCLFAGYYAGNFPKMEQASVLDLNNVGVAVLWIAFANILGLFCGWLSVSIGTAGQKNND
ncbi:MAG: DUF1097 domain-containing protein [Clostridia bacterium]|nr:DUF1097 domain-containing protein [Clostridia bacterium]